MRINQYIICALTCILILFCSVEAYAYKAVNDSSSICEVVSNSTTSRVDFSHFVDENQKKVFIPPDPVLSRSVTITFWRSGGETEVVKGAFKLNSPPKNYSSDFDNYTHDAGELPVRDYEALKDEIVTGISLKSNNRDILAIAPRNFRNSSTIYINRYSPRTTNALLRTSVRFSLDKDEALKWCEQEHDPTDTKPQAPVLTPESRTWNTSPQIIKVSSKGADEIFYNIETTKSNDSVPEDDPQLPEIPEEKDIKVSNDEIKLEADTGEYKKFRIRLRAINKVGWSEASEYFYAIDMLPKDVGKVKEIPDSETKVKGTSLTLKPKSANSTEIRYAIKSSQDAEPEPPSEDEVMNSDQKIVNDGIELTTNANEEKIFKVRFVGYREHNPEGKQFGEVSPSYKYILLGEEVQPGAVSVSPSSGTFTSSTSLEVQSADADRIYYERSTDGTDPQISDGFYQTSHIVGPKGTLDLQGESGKSVKYKIRFQGYNTNSNETGPVSQIHSYTVDLRDDKDNGGDNEENDTSPSPDPAGKEECENLGGTWVEVFGIGVCRNVDRSNHDDSEFTRERARSNPGKKVTDKIHNSDANTYDPTKPFYNKGDGTKSSVKDLFQDLINRHSTFARSSGLDDFSLSANHSKIFLQLEIEKDLILSLPLKVKNIFTTDSDVNELKLNKYSEIELFISNLIIELQYAFADDKKVQHALSENAYFHQEDLDSGAQKYIFDGSDQSSYTVLRPSYAIDTGKSCTVGDIDASSDPNVHDFSICYDDSGKEQRLIPFIYEYDYFYDQFSSQGFDIEKDPFIATIDISNNDHTFVFVPGKTLVYTDNNDNEGVLEIIDDLSGNDLPELILEKDGTTQIIYTKSIK